jgi:hypothetical protein
MIDSFGSVHVLGLGGLGAKDYKGGITKEFLP